MRRATQGGRPKKVATVKYTLVGVVVHLGSMHGGHYVAYVKRGGKGDVPKQWFYASDRTVKQVDFAAVQGSDAYLLFYNRC